MPPKRSDSSHRWLKAHHQDPFVKQAHQQGLRSRAHFKLEEIQLKTHLIQPGMRVLDLGAAPGAWSVFAAQCIGTQGALVACDLLEMKAIPHVSIIQGDFNDLNTQAAIIKALQGPIDVILSDIAPNTSGIQKADQLKAMQLSEAVLAFAVTHLKMGGDLCIKVFHGVGFDAYMKQCRSYFKQVKTFKPKASRSRSAECYIWAHHKTNSVPA